MQYRGTQMPKMYLRSTEKGEVEETSIVHHTPSTTQARVSGLFLYLLKDKLMFVYAMSIIQLL